MNPLPAHPGRSRRELLASLGWAALSLASGGGAAAGEASPATGRLRLAVVPQLTPVEMYRNWQPMVEALARQGLNCDLVIHPSIAAFEREFEQGSADLVYLNPYHMVMAHRAHRYQPLLRDRRPLEGLLLVPRDGPTRTLADLRGQRISFPAPNALGASLYIRAVLARQGVPFEAHYAGNHRNAVRQVLAGDSAAAGLVRSTYELESAPVRQALRVLYATPAIASHPLAAHPRVPADMRTTLATTLQALARDPRTHALMQALQMPEPGAADYEADYAPLDRLGLEKFVVKPQ